MSGKKEARKTMLQNNGWTFMYGDLLEAKSSAYDDSAWYHIGIPHSFGIPYFMENNFYVGYGCYRKTIDIKTEWIGKRLSLEFQGVFQEVEIYLNETLAGVHKGGYTAFTIDISELVVAGKNQLFVRVNNKWNPRLAPRAGEHVFNGGIYRDVNLIVTGEICVSWYGTFIRTPKVSDQMADLHVTIEVENHTFVKTKCTIKNQVMYEEKIVCEFTDEVMLLPDCISKFEKVENIPNPNLWHPDEPSLYILKTLIFDGNQIYDTYTTEFGIRWFEFTAHEGFFLNGKHLDILGANVHQDHAGWSDAVTHAGIYRDVKMIKDCGMNFIRGSHYPHHTVFASECDRQGILFWSELCFWGIGGCQGDGYWNSSAYPVNEEDEKEFEESCVTMLQEMIRTNRNHPSIVVWSMSNEVFFSNARVLDKARSLIKKLVSVSHDCDPTRPAASGGAQREGFDLLGDLAGYNGDGASLYINPGFPSFVSEYGSKIAERPGEYASYYTDGVEQNFAWRSGKALWCGFHHGSIADRMGYMGFIDYYRLPLGSWYWYRKELLGIEPPEFARAGIPYALSLTTDRTEIKTDGTEDAQIIIMALDNNGVRVSNTMPVTLEIIAGGAVFPTGRSIVLSPEKGSFLDGMGAIELRALYAGEIKIMATANGLQGSELILNAIGEEMWNGQIIQYQQKPPCVFVPQINGERTNIARNKPVFCSSYHKGHEPSMLNNENADTFWRAGRESDNEWICIDLEGIKEISEIIITFESIGHETEISASVNGTEYSILDKLSIVAMNKKLTLEPGKEKYRYIKVRYTELPMDIGEIEIY